MKLLLASIVFVFALVAAYDVRFAVPPPKDHVAILWMLKSQPLSMPMMDMVITNTTSYPGGGQLEVYHLSNLSYSHLVSRITYQVINDESKPESKPESESESKYTIRDIVVPWRPTYVPLSTPPVCPDNSIEFVSATAYPQYPSALNYTVNNYQLAVAMGYNAQILVGPAATRQNYLNYLSCPNLGGFSNIGHGDQGEIFVYDGAVTSQDLAGLNFQNRTTIIFNSCNVMNDPMSTVMDNNGARFYAGGVSDLMIGSSEPVTYCFWNNTFQSKNMTDAMLQCAQLDPQDIWGSEDPSGQQTFQP